MKPKISVILNVYRRGSVLPEQILSIRGQSIEPIEILVWENGNDSVPIELRNGLKISRSNYNFGVWARFAYALNAKGDFICILDDDTIPGTRWFENCLETMVNTPGLLGARGLVFENKNSYSMNKDVGIYNPNMKTEQVDIVGHSWFFKKEWLSAFWACADQRFQDDLAGEDIHFSFALQKLLNLPTLVPRHPENDYTFWGANPELSKIYGSNKDAISSSKESLLKFESALNHYRKLGFKTISEQTNLKSKYPNFIYIFIQNFPNISHKLIKLFRKISKKR